MKKEKSDGFPSKQRISRRGLWGGRPQYLLSKPIPSDHNEQLQKALAGLQCCCYEVSVPFHFRLVLLCVCVCEFPLTDELLPRLCSDSDQICIGFGTKAEASAPKLCSKLSRFHQICNIFHTDDVHLTEYEDTDLI